VHAAASTTAGTFIHLIDFYIPFIHFDLSYILIYTC
jgi:hypothetical protein